MLEKERQYFDENKAKLIAAHSGKFVLVKDAELIGAFNTIEEAISEGARRFGLSSFLVRQVTPDPAPDINIPALNLGILNANSTRPV